VRGSGDGWVTCAAGHRHWGRFGAAGLLLRREASPAADVLLQLRVEWSHHGGTWGIPGGARDTHESPVQAAFREAAEETSVDPAAVRAEASLVDDHGGWSYTTVVASTASVVDPRPVGAESVAVRWTSPSQADELALHPGFAGTWPLLRTVRPAPVLLVDAANVIGSRPDGWWRDRAAAVRRLRDALVATSSTGLALGAAAGLPTSEHVWRSFPEIVVVTEGAARGVPGVPGVEVVTADGSGDDALVEVAAARKPGPRTVVAVTADRELRRRLEALGARILGPRTLWELIDPA
jgi:8-oxo-dGTP diphosphatase